MLVLPVVLSTSLHSDPNGIRTRAAAVKGRCPRPLNDGAKKRDAVKHQEPRLPALVAIVQAERYL